MIVALQAPQAYGPQPMTMLVKVVQEVAGGDGHGVFVVHVPEKMTRPWRVGTAQKMIRASPRSLAPGPTPPQTPPGSTPLPQNAPSSG
jgi:hypothetical protein